MKLLLSILIAVLLIFNGISALYSGYHLMMHPDGSSIHLPLKLLEGSPFHSYLIPGIILFVVNGVLSMLVLFTLLFNNDNASEYTMLQGVLLAGWILVQTVLIQTVEPMHLIMAGVGIALVILGGIRRNL
ncbi:hypothetical protein ACQ33O_12135 [Ferruginibacter sp. SUN002]|uniref:hypothetical protein n=1 Tax=Ferruginibacter sp. SUN002 TaxID=2937789 RepID=UPI003D36C4D7